jgi:hypothetical protein
MYPALRLLNLAAIVLALVAGVMRSGREEMDVAYLTGRWMGAGLVMLMPFMTFLALRRHASPGLRRTARVLCWMMGGLLVIGALGAFMSAERLAPVILGVTIFALLCGVNLWGLSSIARHERLGDESPEGGFIGRYWRGQLPFGQMFWVGGILTLLFQVLVVGVFGALTGWVSLRGGAALVLGMFATTLLLFAFHGVGLWRSATRRAREAASPWPIMVKLGIVAGTLAFGFLSARHLFVPLREHAFIAVGRDRLPPIEARVTTGNSVLLLHGSFGSGSADRVRHLLDEAAAVRTVALSSTGGRLREASEIAELVRKRGLDTYVDTRCESACTFVFLAGKDRAATPNARIGFHRPSFAGIAPTGLDPATEQMLRTYRDAGIPAEFLDRVAATDPANMWYPSPRELESAGVINRVSLGGETSALGYLAATSRQDLAAAFRSVPMMVALERHFPGTIDAAVKAAWMERTQGGVDSAVSNAARRVVANLYPKLLASANDASLDVFVDIMVEQMKAARDISTDACRLLLAGQLNISQVLSPELVQREQDWALGVLQSPRLVARAPVDPLEFERTMTDATAALDPEILEVVGEPERFADHPKRQCESTIALYDRIVSLPPDDRHLLLRGMFQAGSL